MPAVLLALSVMVGFILVLLSIFLVVMIVKSYAGLAVQKKLLQIMQVTVHLASQLQYHLGNSVHLQPL
jgi:hypothetical protein